MVPYGMDWLGLGGGNSCRVQLMGRALGASWWFSRLDLACRDRHSETELMGRRS